MSKGINSEEILVIEKTEIVEAPNQLKCKMVVDKAGILGEMGRTILNINFLRDFSGIIALRPGFIFDIVSFHSSTYIVYVLTVSISHSIF